MATGSRPSTDYHRHARLHTGSDSPSSPRRRRRPTPGGPITLAGRRSHHVGGRQRAFPAVVVDPTFRPVDSEVDVAKREVAVVVGEFQQSEGFRHPHRRPRPRVGRRPPGCLGPGADTKSGSRARRRVPRDAAHSRGQRRAYRDEPACLVSLLAEGIRTEATLVRSTIGHPAVVGLELRGVPVGGRYQRTGLPQRRRRHRRGPLAACPCRPECLDDRRQRAGHDCRHRPGQADRRPRHPLHAQRTARADGSGHRRTGRTEQLWIGGSDLGPHGAAFIPPHHRRVPAAIDDLVAFIDPDDRKRNQLWWAPELLDALDRFASRADRRSRSGR
jgi:hypothetical protein